LGTVVYEHKKYTDRILRGTRYRRRAENYIHGDGHIRPIRTLRIIWGSRLQREQITRGASVPHELQVL
jgi:hypothetical protein